MTKWGFYRTIAAFVRLYMRSLGCFWQPHLCPESQTHGTANRRRTA